jgi:hypothetical protein
MYNYVEKDLPTYVNLNSYQDKSIACIIPTRGSVDVEVIDSWFKLITPVNHRFSKLFIANGELADAYNTGVLLVLNNPMLSACRFLLTMEDDNIPPPDGILKLIDSMIEHEHKDDKYWAISGVYWTKPSRDCIEHAPIAWGCVEDGEWNMKAPPLKEDGSVTQCCLIPQGFTLYDLDLFRKMEYPWFKVVEHNPNNNDIDWEPPATQDSYFFKKVWEAGLKVGIRADVKVGHLDPKTKQIW